MTAALSGSEVVVTGAGGFIGPHVVDALLQSGARVRALVGAPGQRVAELPSHVEVRFADIEDGDALRNLLEGATMVVHLAGPASVRESLEAPVECVRVHVGGTVCLLDACRHGGVRQVVHLSSAEVYGRPHSNPVSEDHPIQPRSPYGAAKAGAEFAVHAYSASFRIAAAILRPFSIYGPGQSGDSLIGTIARQARAGNLIELADLKPVRDYCYVGDIAKAIVRACVADLEGCTVLNIGSGEGTSVESIAKLMAEAMGRTPDVRERSAGRRSASAEIYHLVSDSTRARELLDWTASTPLAEGLAATAHSFARQDA